MRNGLQVLMQRTMLTIQQHAETTSAIDEAQQQQINEAITGLNINATKAQHQEGQIKEIQEVLSEQVGMCKTNIEKIDQETFRMAQQVNENKTNISNHYN